MKHKLFVVIGKYKIQCFGSIHLYSRDKKKNNAATRNHICSNFLIFNWNFFILFLYFFISIIENLVWKYNTYKQLISIKQKTNC